MTTNRDATTTDTTARPGSGWLLGLVLATFVIGTDDFVIAGILPEISSDLGVSEAAAGQLVTAFSLTYAVAAPVMAVATARIPRKALIVGGLAGFAVVNVGTAFASGFGWLIGLRVLAALIAATISPAAFAVAGRLATPARAGRAIGTVAAGLTVSLVAGVPIGVGLSDRFGWRSTFLGVAVLTAIAVAVTAVTLPALPRLPIVRLRARLLLLRRPAVLLGVLGTVTGACAGLMTYTYIAPITRELTGIGDVAVFIVVMGVAGAAGTVLGGRLTDGWGVDRTLMATFGGVLLATVALAVVGRLTGGAAPVWLVGGLLTVWGVAAWGNNPPMTSRAMRMAGAAGTEAVALNTSGLYLGVALAGAIGGGALDAGGGAGVLLAGSIVGLVICGGWASALRPDGLVRDRHGLAAPPRSRRTGDGRATGA